MISIEYFITHGDQKARMAPNAIQSMEAAYVQKAGMVHFVRNVHVQIICLVKNAITHVNVTKIIREAVIRGRENVIVRLDGAVTYVIVHVHS